MTYKRKTQKKYKVNQIGGNGVETFKNQLLQPLYILFGEEGLLKTSIDYWYSSIETETNKELFISGFINDIKSIEDNDTNLINIVVRTLNLLLKLIYYKLDDRFIASMQEIIYFLQIKQRSIQEIIILKKQLDLQSGAAENIDTNYEVKLEKYFELIEQIDILIDLKFDVIVKSPENKDELHDIEMLNEIEILRKLLYEAGFIEIFNDYIGQKMVEIIDRIGDVNQQQRDALISIKTKMDTINQLLNTYDPIPSLDEVIIPIHTELNDEIETIKSDLSINNYIYQYLTMENFHIYYKICRMYNLHEKLYFDSNQLDYYERYELIDKNCRLLQKIQTMISDINRLGDVINITELDFFLCNQRVAEDKWIISRSKYTTLSKQSLILLNNVLQFYIYSFSTIIDEPITLRSSGQSENQKTIFSKHISLFENFIITYKYYYQVGLEIADNTSQSGGSVTDDGIYLSHYNSPTNYGYIQISSDYTSVNSSYTIDRNINENSTKGNNLSFGSVKNKGKAFIYEGKLYITNSSKSTIYRTYNIKKEQCVPVESITVSTIFSLVQSLFDNGNLQHIVTREKCDMKGLANTSRVNITSKICERFFEILQIKAVGDHIPTRGLQEHLSKNENYERIFIESIDKLACTIPQYMQQMAFSVLFKYLFKKKKITDPNRKLLNFASILFYVPYCFEGYLSYFTFMNKDSFVGYNEEQVHEFKNIPKAPFVCSLSPLVSMIIGMLGTYYFHYGTSHTNMEDNLLEMVNNLKIIEIFQGIFFRYCELLESYYSSGAENKEFIDFIAISEDGRNKDIYKIEFRRYAYKYAVLWISINFNSLKSGEFYKQFIASFGITDYDLNEDTINSAIRQANAIGLLIDSFGHDFDDMRNLIVKCFRRILQDENSSKFDFLKLLYEYVYNTSFIYKEDFIDFFDEIFVEDDIIAISHGQTQGLKKEVVNTCFIQTCKIAEYSVDCPGYYNDTYFGEFCIMPKSSLFDESNRLIEERNIANWFYVNIRFPINEEQTTILKLKYITNYSLKPFKPYNPSTALDLDMKQVGGVRIKRSRETNGNPMDGPRFKQQAVEQQLPPPPTEQQAAEGEGEAKAMDEERQPPPPPPTKGQAENIEEAAEGQTAQPKQMNVEEQAAEEGMFNFKIGLISETYENHKILIIDPEVVLYVFPFSSFDEGDKRTTHFKIEMIESIENKLDIPIFFNGSDINRFGRITLSFFNDDYVKKGTIHRSRDTLQTQAIANYKLYKIIQSVYVSLKGRANTSNARKKIKDKLNIEGNFTAEITSTKHKFYNPIYRLLKDTSRKLISKNNNSNSFYKLIIGNKETLIRSTIRNALH